MRLEQFRLRNFKTFEDATVEFAAATVLIGANDSGKSAIIDALAWLFSGSDRFDQRPRLHTHTFEPTRPTMSQFLAGGISNPREVVVAGRFADLTAHERRVWKPLLDNDRLVLARRLDYDNDGAELHVVVTPDAFERLVETMESASEHEPGDGRAALGREFEEFEDGYWLSLETLADAIREESLPFWPKPWPDPYVDFPAASNFVLIRGPEFGAQSPTELLRPLIRRVIRASLLGADHRRSFDADPEAPDRDVLTRKFVEAADEAIAQISEAYSTSFARYAPGVWGAVIHRLSSSYAVSDHLIDLVIGDLTIDVVAPPDGTTEAARVGRGLDDYGAGTRRAGAIAALELFRDPDIWPTYQSVVLAIEEPEVGLHPSAQRHLAAALSGMHTFGVQTVVVTHSPIFVNSAPKGALRLVRSNRRGVTNLGSVVVEPEDLGVIITELGVRPSDVLLARMFIVVEGESDALIFNAWARSMGVELGAAGVQLVPAGGHTTAATIGRFLSIAYEGADVLVVLDQGRDTEKTRREIDSKYGGRVKTRLMSQLEIEGYFSPAAVERWLAVNGVPTDKGVHAKVASALRGPNYKRGLRELTEQLLDREYRVAVDGAAIAGLTREEEINPEIQELLSRALDGDSAMTDGGWSDA